ncbi:MAG: hypothetical protein AAF184_14010 [Pseudomonadota bacterium]
MESQAPTPTAASEDLGLIDLVALLKRLWLPCMIGGAVLGACTLGLSYFLQPTYDIRVVLEYAGDPIKADRVPSGGGALGGLTALAGISLGSSGDPKEIALARLRSWEFAKEFIAENELSPILNAEQWDEGRQDWKDPSNPPNEWLTAKRFRRDVLYVSDDIRTGLVTVNITWTDPEIASQWATKIVSMINARLRETSVLETERAIAHLTQQLNLAQNVELQRTIAGLLEGQIETMMFADIRDEFAFRTIDPPQVPPRSEYDFPSHGLFAVLGAFFGAALAAAWVVFFRGGAKRLAS